MTDIVERLRGNLDDGIKRHPSAIKLEAAAEIEGLRAKIERWQAQSIAQYAEIKRLRAVLQEIADMGTLQYAAKAVLTARRALEPKP